MDTERSYRIHEKIKRELGCISKYLVEPDVVEVMLNPGGKLWVERLGKGMECVGEIKMQQAESLMMTIASTMGTVITRDNPILECELPVDGSRFQALLPPIVSSPVFTIRKRASKIFSLDDYVDAGIMTKSQQYIISQAVLKRKNILIVGGTGTGKTTLTNAIIAEIVSLTPEHRLVIIEDTAEIQCMLENSVFLRATDAVGMLHLLRATMRLRPDRILVGEVRGPEALTLLKSWNTGHPGGIATIHANSDSNEAGLIRLEQLIAESSQSPMQKLIAEAVDILIYIVKTAEGRQVKRIVAVKGYEDEKYQFEIME